MILGVNKKPTLTFSGTETIKLHLPPNTQYKWMKLINVSITTDE